MQYLKKNQLEITQKKLHSEVDELRKKIEIESPKIDKINQLELRKKELIEYAKTAIHEIQREINDNERKVEDCKGCFEYAKLREDFESKMQRIEQAIEDTLKKIQELTMQTVSLKEKQSLVSKLQLKDNRCPVCDSNVEKLNPLFQEEHLKQEINTIQQQITSKQEEKQMYNQKRKEFLEKLQKSRNAEATLRAHSINNEEELKKIQEDTEMRKKNIQHIPATTNQNLVEISKLDAHTKIIFENISKLENETEGFNEQEFLQLKKSVNEKQSNLSQVDRQVGAIFEQISKNDKQIKEIQNAMSELKIVKEYIKSLDEIQTNVFNRDGPVATSLRSWALNTISSKTSEYLTLLNTKIQRVLLSEKNKGHFSYMLFQK